MYKFVQRFALDLSSWDEDNKKSSNGDENVCMNGCDESFETQSQCKIDDLCHTDFFSDEYEKLLVYNNLG